MPKGYIALIEGNPKVGKTNLISDWVALLSKGEPLPNEYDRREPQKIVWFSADEQSTDIIVPRLMALGADLDNIQVVDVNEELVLPDDLESMAHTIRTFGASIAVIDPFASFISGAVDTHVDAKLRRLMKGVATMAASLGISLLALEHLSKQVNGSSYLRGNGGVGYLGQARASGRVGFHPDDDRMELSARRIVTPVGTNLVTPDSISFRLKTSTINPEFAAVEYVEDDRQVGYWELTDDPKSDAKAEKAAEQNAGNFLAVALNEAGPDGIAVEELKQRAERHQVAWRTVERARAVLKEKVKTTGSARRRDMRWVWNDEGPGKTMI